MLLLGSMLQERQLDTRNLTTGQQTQLKQALDNGKLAAWVARRYRNGKPGPDALVKASKTQPAALPPAPALSQAQLAAYQPPFPKVATGNGSIAVSSPPQTLDDMLSKIAHFNPKSGVTEPKQLGRLDGFKPLTIPIVFQRAWPAPCMQTCQAPATAATGTACADCATDSGCMRLVAQCWATRTQTAPTCRRTTGGPTRRRKTSSTASTSSTAAPASASSCRRCGALLIAVCMLVTLAHLDAGATAHAWAPSCLCGRTHVRALPRAASGALGPAQVPVPQPWRPAGVAGLWQGMLGELVQVRWPLGGLAATCWLSS